MPSAYFGSLGWVWPPRLDRDRAGAGDRGRCSFLGLLGLLGQLGGRLALGGRLLLRCGLAAAAAGLGERGLVPDVDALLGGGGALGTSARAGDEKVYEAWRGGGEGRRTGTGRKDQRRVIFLGRSSVLKKNL